MGRNRLAEVIGAQCTEIDLEKKVWVIPADRLKDRRTRTEPQCHFHPKWVPSGMRLEFGGGISGNMRLSFQAARSIG
jgi:hypothetical protein